MWKIKFGLLMTVAAENSRALNSGPDQELQLGTSIVNQRYCSDSGSTFPLWTLNLRYLNQGNQPILVDRKSGRISRTLVSESVKAAAAGRYLYAPIPVYADLNQLGFRSTPDETSFLVLKPTESFSLKANCRVSVYDTTDETKDDLHPGDYVLQVRVATWYYYADPSLYREKWSDRGYLWSDTITSQPMPITIKRQSNIGPCSERRSIGESHLPAKALNRF